MTLKLPYFLQAVNFNYESHMREISLASRIKTTTMFYIVQCTLVIIVGMQDCKTIFSEVDFDCSEPKNYDWRQVRERSSQFNHLQTALWSHFIPATACSNDWHVFFFLRSVCNLTTYLPFIVRSTVQTLKFFDVFLGNYFHTVGAFKRTAQFTHSRY